MFFAARLLFCGTDTLRVTCCVCMYVCVMLCTERRNRYARAFKSLHHRHHFTCSTALELLLLRKVSYRLIMFEPKQIKPLPRKTSQYVVKVQVYPEKKEEAEYRSVLWHLDTPPPPVNTPVTVLCNLPFIKFEVRLFCMKRNMCCGGLMLV